MYWLPAERGRRQAAASSAMSVVHEEVHQRAGQQQQERQRSKKVRAVLAEQEVRGNAAHNDQSDQIARAPEAFRFGVVRGMVVIHSILQSAQADMAIALAATAEKIEIVRTNFIWSSR